VLVLRTATDLSAQQLPIVELEPVVVTASVFPKNYNDTPSVVTIVTRDEIERLQANRVSDVLRLVPGLHVDEMGGRGGISSVYVRGGDPNFTVIMIDGIQINDPTNSRGGSVDLSSLTPEHIDSIEVLRGPISSLYGSDAMGGAINIRTRRGKERSYNVLAEGGTSGYARSVLQASGSLSPLNYSASFAFNRNDAEVKKDRFNLGRIGINVDVLELPRSSLRVTTQYTKTGTKAFPEGSGGPRLAILRDVEGRDAQDLVAGAQFSFRGSWRQEVSAGLFYRTERVDSPGVQIAPASFQIPPAKFDTEFARLQFLWKHMVQLTSRWSLAAGAQLKYEIGNREGLQRLSVLGAPDTRSDFELGRFTPSILLESDLSLWSNLKFTTGFRLDIPKGGQPEVSPRAGLLYRLESATALRLNVGRGFKLPSFNALGDPLIGNPKLKPETSVGMDAGIEHSFYGHRASLGLTYFYNHFSGLVDLDSDLARGGIFKLVNLSTVETQGVEVSFRISPNDAVTVKTHFSYLDSDIKGSKEPLRNRPRFAGGVVLQGELTPQLSLSADVNVVGRKFDLQIPTARRSTAGHARANLTVTYQPVQAWRFFGVVQNVTNNRYEDYIGFQSPGIGLRFGVAYRR
jgi:iron complex outermembrane receptor protein/vitamin B12 transporter